MSSASTPRFRMPTRCSPPALAGIGRHSEAHLALDDAIRESRRCNDEFGVQSVYASRVRILVQEGRAEEACNIEPPDLEASLRAMRGEVLASRGLALASLGRLPKPGLLRAEAIETTAGVEAACSCCGYRCGLRCERSERRARWRLSRS